MHLDPKARTAAIEAANEIAIDGAPVPDYVDAVVRAYLAASLPADAAELVERLEETAIGCDHTNPQTEARAFADDLGRRASKEQIVMHYHARQADKLAIDLAAKDAELARLTRIIEVEGPVTHWKKRAERAEAQLAEANKALERWTEIEALLLTEPTFDWDGNKDGASRQHYVDVTLREWEQKVASAARRARPAEQAVTEAWQPIATANKDARQLLLGVVRQGRLEEVYLGGFRYAVNDDEVSCWWGDCVDDEICPTHWLPVPPLTAALAQEKGR